MSANSPSPTQSISPTTSTQKKKRQAVATDHKDILKYIMFHEEDGKLNKIYQECLRIKCKKSLVAFWQYVSNKLNTTVHPPATYSSEVMICRILMKVNALINSPLLHSYFKNYAFSVLFAL